MSTPGSIKTCIKVGTMPSRVFGGTRDLGLMGLGFRVQGLGI